MTTRLLVGMLTPAMRATAVTPVAGGPKSPAAPAHSGLSGRPTNDNATPSPFPRGPASFDFSDRMPALLMDSSAVRQPLRAFLPFRRAALPRPEACAAGLAAGLPLAAFPELGLAVPPLVLAGLVAGL